MIVGNKELRNKLQRVLSAQEIDQVEAVPAGTLLRQGATYRDLADTDSEPFVAGDKMLAREDQWLVAKHGTPYEIWNKIKGHFIH